MSLNNVKEFISGVRDGINTIREDLDKEVDEAEAEDQVEFSIPQQKLISQKELQKNIEKVSRLLETKKASSNYSREELGRIESEYEQTISNIHSVKKQLEDWSLQEKIINRRTLKIIQILCQLTVKNGIDDETLTWVASSIIFHIKSKDVENIDICLSIIVDILLYDKDLSASFLKIYQSMLNMTGIEPSKITDENPKSAQIITIIKALYDMFCILDNFGLDCCEDYTLIRNNEEELIENEIIVENDRIRLQLSNKLFSILLSRFLFC